MNEAPFLVPIQRIDHDSDRNNNGELSCRTAKFATNSTVPPNYHGWKECSAQYWQGLCDVEVPGILSVKQ